MWHVRLDVREEWRPRLVRSLSDDERARAARYGVPLLADRFTIRRGWLRYLLSHRLVVSSASLQILENPSGKPFLAGFPTLFFSASSRENDALIAISDAGEVGVDIEAVTDFDPETMRHILTDAEYARLTGAEPTERPRLFTQFWCAKEAAAKALGRGMAIPFGSLEVEEACVVHLPTGDRFTLHPLPLEAPLVGALVCP